MCFTSPGRPERNAIFALVDPFATDQLQYQRLVQGQLGSKIKGIEAFGLRKARQPNPALDVAALAINALEFTKTQQKVRVIGPVLRRFPATKI
jgi:hypothetical protein